MLGEKELKRLSEKILALSKADQAEVLLGSEATLSLRFANSFIHQPTAQFERWARLRLVLGKKVGVATTNQLDEKSLRELVWRAEEICRWQKEDPGFHSLPEKKKLGQVKGFDQKLATLPPNLLAKRVARLIDQAKEKRLVASGNLERGISELAVANSLGVWAYRSQTRLQFSTVMMGKRGSGYGSSLSQGWKPVSIELEAQKAIKKAVSSENPVRLPPGEYEVVLEPAALGEILDFFAWLGPNARIYHEEASYFKNRLGKKIFSPQLTMIDDPLNPQGLPASFDFEGQPKKKTVIVQKGVIKNVVYDSYYSKKYQKRNTGHALPAPNTLGPLAAHLRIKPGKESLEVLIGKVRKGLLVSRFWYLRVVHFGEMVLTGMTRDGLFLIENGQVVRPVQNLRFTESIPRMFKNIVGVGREVKVLPSGGGGAYFVPPLRITAFRFTS